MTAAWYSLVPVETNSLTKKTFKGFVSLGRLAQISEHNQYMDEASTNFPGESAH
jgi:hypothetical protein